MRVFFWRDIDLSGSVFTEERGTALTVGSFDGPHCGHAALFDAVLTASGAENLIPGIVTFTRPLPAHKNPAAYQGDIATLRLRLLEYERQGFAFAVLIDFSNDFARMLGIDFLRVLSSGFSLRFLAEGQDFRCGHRGLCGKKEIEAFAVTHGIDTVFLPPVLHNGCRVSSSSIRQGVLNGKFSDVRLMLGRSYTLDMNAVNRTAEADGAVIFARRDFSQALPQHGSYEVMVNTSDGSLRTRLEAGLKTLRLFGSVFNESTRIQTIEFIS